MVVSATGSRGAGSRLGLLALKSLRLKTRDRNANVQKCGSLFCMLTWTAQLCKVPWGGSGVLEPGHCLRSSSWPGESRFPLPTPATPGSCSPVP